LLPALGGTALGSGFERLALLGDREPAVRSIAARRGPLGPERDPLWDAMLSGEITERGYWRARSEEIGAALGRPGWPITEFMHLLYRVTGDVVRPEAAALVADAEALLRDAGVEIGWLACAIGNERAARFYEKCGWQRAGNVVEHVQIPDGTMQLEVWRYEKRLRD